MRDSRSGPLAWFASNHVVANILMIFILVSGALSLARVVVEVFPEFDTGIITIRVPYLGASPAEAVMIGDRLYTDMELARRVGCDSILVLSGEAKAEDLKDLSWEPSLVVANLGAILIR